MELRKVLNEKMLTQELQMISIVHMKLCKSWDCTALSLGAGLICMHGMFQLYLLYYPLVCLGYLLPRIRNESMPFFFISMAIMVKLAYQIESLKQSVRKNCKCIQYDQKALGKYFFQLLTRREVIIH